MLCPAGIFFVNWDFIMNSSYLILYVVVMYLCIFLPTMQRRKRLRIKKAKNKGAKKTMPVELIKDYIGKLVTIYVEGELGGFQGTILGVEGNWLKVEEKKHIRLVNGDMITQIRAVK